MRFAQQRIGKGGLALIVCTAALCDCRPPKASTQPVPKGSTLVRFGPDAASTCIVPNLQPNEIRDLRWDLVSRHLFALRSVPDGVKLSVYTDQGKLLNETTFGDGALLDSRLARIDGAVSFTIGYIKAPEHEDLITVDQLGKPTSRMTFKSGESAEDFLNQTEYRGRQALLKEIKPPVVLLMPTERPASPPGVIGEPSTDLDAQASSFPTLLGNMSKGPFVFRRSDYLVAGGAWSMFVARRMGGRWVTAEFGKGIGQALHWQYGDDIRVTSCAVDGPNIFFGFQPLQNPNVSYVAKIEFPGQFKFGGVKPGLYAPPLEDVIRGGRFH